DQSGIPYAVMGGIAASALGRDRWTHDVDLIVRAEDATDLLERYAADGFATEERDQDWLYKAFRQGVMIDLIFQVATGAVEEPITLDEEMCQRVRRVVFHGVDMPVLAPEDLAVIKALVHKEHRARHWFDALGLLAAGGIDWTYLLRRARRGPCRVLSLLLYARSDGIEVPSHAIKALLGQVPLDGERAADGTPAPAPAAAPALTAAPAEADPYLVARVLDRLARDSRTAELEVDVRLEQDAVVLTGCVATPERQAALDEVVHTVLPGRPVRNLTTAGPPPAGPRVERLP
ncbi:MAG TPA: nucleotidyltransferase, partial [Actinomycetota bacterium]